MTLKITQPSGPPYPLSSVPLGGIPTPLPDIPICAVLITLFTLAGLSHLAFLRKHITHPPTNHDRPIPPLLLTMFCLLRLAALSLRIAWARNKSHLGLAIASTEFTFAGVTLLLILNLILARRVVRDYTPFGGQYPAALRICRVLVGCVFACLVMVISASVVAFFTRDAENLRTGRDVVLFSLVFLSVMAIIPAGVVLWVWMFGEAREGIARRGVLSVFTALLLTLEVGFRCGVVFGARPVANPGWLNSKVCYYFFIFVIELVIVYAILLARSVNGMY